MAITAETRQDIMELAVAANNAAPGTTLLSELVAMSTSGKTLLEIADSLASSASFTATYPTFQTATEFATEFLGNLVPEASAAAKAEGVTIIEGMLAAGSSRGAIILEAATYLAALDESNASFGSSAALFNHRVEVATYHTITSEAAAPWAIPASVTSSDDSVATGKSAVDTALTPAAEAVEAKSITLTTTADTGASATGTSADDTFSGAVVGAGAAGTTLQAGDILDGGDGSDTLLISATGAAGTYSLLGVQSSGIETISVNDFTNAGVVTIDGALISGVTSYILNASGDDGDVTFSNAGAIASAKMSNGTGDLTINYTAAASAGTADVQTLAVSNITAGSFASAGVETISVTGSLTNNTITGISGSKLTTLNLSGDKNLTVTNALANTVTTIDGSGTSGKLSFSVTAGGNATITGGSGNDTIGMAGGLTNKDVIDGGDGDDLVTIDIADNANGATNATQNFTGWQLSNVETVRAGINDAQGTDIDAKAADNFELHLIAATDDRDATVNNIGATDTVGIINNSAGTLELGDVALNLEDDTGTADAMSVKLVAASNADQTLDVLTLDDAAESATIAVSGATGSGKEYTLSSLIADGAKTITINGTSNFITQLDQSGTNVTTTVDASGLTGTFGFTENVTNNLTIKGASGKNTIAMGATLNASDSITGGAATTDVVTATINGLTATTGKLNLTDIENLSLIVTDGSSNTVDLSSSTGVSKILVAPSGANGDGGLTLKGVSSGLNIASVSQATDYDGNIVVTLADATGTDDSLTFTNNRADATQEENINLDATGVEILNIVSAATAVVDTNLDVSGMTGLTTINISGGTATTLVDVNSGTNKLPKTVTSVSQNGTGDLVADASVATSVGVNFTVNTLRVTDANGTVITGSGSTTSDDTLTGTFKADDTTAEFASRLNGIENYVLTLNDAVNITATTNEGIGDGDNAVKTVVLKGGNSLTSYTQIDGAVDGTKLTSFDASALGGALKLEIDGSRLDNLTVKGSTAATTDSVTVSGVNGLTATTGAASMEGVETIVLETATAASTVDLAGVTGATLVAVENDQNVTLKGVTTQTVQIGGVAEGTGTDDYSGTLTVSLADATGDADALTIKTAGNSADNDINATLATTGIETVTLSVSTSQKDIDLGVAGVKGNIVVTGGKAGEDLDLTKGGTVKLGTSTTSVDASAYAGTITVTTEANTGTSVSVKGTGAATITGSTSADTITVGSHGAVTHTVNGGAGTDTANITLTTGTTDMTNYTNVETYNITINSAAGAVVTTAAANKFFNDGQAESIIVSGGAATSTFDSGTDGVDSNSGVTLFDFSGFNGRLNDLLFDADELDATVTVKGGKLATDVVSATYSAAQTVKMSGVETFGITMTGTAAIDLSNVTDLTTITVASDTTARVATLSTVDSSVAIKLTADDVNDGVTLVASDKTDTDNNVALEITSANAGEAILIDMADMETLTITNKAANADINLTNFDMDTASKVNTLVVKGAVNTDIVALSVDTTTIDASAMTAGGLDIDARAADTAITFTGSAAAADSVIMTMEADALDGGEKASIADTLDVNYGAVLGGIKVDLTATDNVVSMDGSTNSAVQQGFENVALDGYTGSYGANVIGNSEANTVTGTSQTDKITLAGGNDKINVVATASADNDTVTGGTGTDTIVVADGVVNTTLAQNIIDLATPGNGLLSNNGAFANYSGFENVDASAAGGTKKVTIVGDANANTLTGGGGDDKITGGAGADKIAGGAGTDAIVIAADGDTGTPTFGGGSTSTATLDIITINADGDNDTISLAAAIGATLADEFDAMVALKTSGNITAAHVVAGTDGNSDGKAAQYQGTYSSADDLFTVNNSGTDTLVIYADDGGAAANAGLVLVGVAGVDSITDGVIVV